MQQLQYMYSTAALYIYTADGLPGELLSDTQIEALPLFQTTIANSALVTFDAVADEYHWPHVAEVFHQNVANFENVVRAHISARVRANEVTPSTPRAPLIPPVIRVSAPPTVTAPLASPPPAAPYQKATGSSNATTSLALPAPLPPHKKNARKSSVTTAHEAPAPTEPRQKPLAETTVALRPAAPTSLGPHRQVAKTSSIATPVNAPAPEAPHQKPLAEIDTPTPARLRAGAEPYNPPHRRLAEASAVTTVDTPSATQASAAPIQRIAKSPVVRLVGRTQPRVTVRCIVVNVDDKNLADIKLD
jgi:hypothetical protein